VTLQERALRNPETIAASNRRASGECYVLNALKPEEWRVNAMFLVIETLLKLRHGPDEAIERMTKAVYSIIHTAEVARIADEIAAVPKTE